ncbi:MAG: CoA transferase [Pseudomonadota bacterium]
MKKQAIEAAIREARLPLPDCRYEVTGEDPFFRSPMNLMTGAGAALVMMGSAVTNLWQLQTGRSQQISIDGQHAALSLLSAWLLTIDGKSAFTALATQADRQGVSGAFTCQDGARIHLQPGFPHHTDAILGVLGCDRADVARVIGEWPSVRLETALSEAGAPAVLIRDQASWAAHEQGMAMRDIPVVEFERLDDCEPVPMGSGTTPLEGVRVLDLTRVLAGPTCARMLGEFGADVLHVDGPNLPDLRAGQADTSHGKRMTYLDLDTTEGQSKLLDLASSADVFVQSYRTGSLARRGFGPSELARHRPGTIYVSVNCYGHHGPWVNRPGYDGNAQAASGIQDIQRQPPEPGVALAINDYGTAYWGAYGAMTALHKRATEGGSWHVRVSLMQSALWYLRMGTPHDRRLGLPGDEVLEIARDYMTTESSHYGELCQLTPALGLSETPPTWQRGTPVPGGDRAAWLSG